MKIEKGICIKSYSKQAKFDDLILQMEVGDSVLIESHTDLQQMRDAAHRQSKKVSARRAKKNEPGASFRVWRIK